MNFRRITESRNLILLAIFFCCIGGCRLIYQYDDKKDKERTDILNHLSQLNTQEEISAAIHAPETKAYIFQGYRFDSYDLVKDPEEHLDGEYLYIKCTNYTWEKKTRKDGFGNDETYQDWSESFSPIFPKFAKVYMDKGIELSGFSNAKIEGLLLTDTYHDKGHGHKTEYEYLLPSTKFTFIAELGQNNAKLGYQGAKVLIVGDDREALVKKINFESGSFFIKFLLLAVCVIILILIYRDIKNN